MSFTGILVLIPTRNRSDFAVNAIDSVLRQQNCRVEIVVSDNSTESAEIDFLANYCRCIADERLTYLRPPESLPMTEHWDWAMNQALRRSQASHVLYLTDRMVLKPQALSELESIARAFPDKAISYTTDSIDDSRDPHRLQQKDWTGAIFAISAAYNLRLTADLRVFSQTFPKMLNSCVPRELLLRVKKKFGKFFDSVSPDYNFAYSCLTLVDETLYYDKPPLLEYGLKRSNGVNLAHGTHSKDAIDFLNNMKIEAAVIPNSPLPIFDLASNCILHEYYFVKSKTDAHLFADFNQNHYLRVLLKDILNIKNPVSRRTRLKKYYAAIGWHSYYFHGRVWFDECRDKYQLRTLLKNNWQKLIGKTIAARAPEKIFDTVTAAMTYAFENPTEPSSDLTIVGCRIGATGFSPSNDEVRVVANISELLQRQPVIKAA